KLPRCLSAAPCAKSRIQSHTRKKPGSRRDRMPRKTVKKSSAPRTKLDNKQLQQMYTHMVRIREFEEAVKRTFIEHPGVIRGHSHLGDGAEASIVGALSTRRESDFVMPSYRCHGYPIVL